MTQASHRRSGLLIPLTSLRTEGDWGIGEIPALGAVAPWLVGAGQTVLQLLPINELPDHETSPYSALSAMAIDPRFIALDGQLDFEAAGGRAALGADLERRVQAAHAARRVDYAAVRATKAVALRRAFDHFAAHDLGPGTVRGARFARFAEAHAWWLDDYALFRALHHEQGARPWTQWPDPLRVRDAAALADARARLGHEILFRKYLQWVADEQWCAAREAAGDVALFGDLPFMVASDSADVWARQEEFRLDASLGVPPDAFSATGQDWNLPVYRWDVMEAGGFQWLRARARRNADLFSGYRVDHLVGFFRTFYREPDGASGFTPADEPAQRALGERVLRLFLDSGATIVAEDLGVVPDFVRREMAGLQVPGCKVFRWERRWRDEGQPFIDPSEYPRCSVATTGTHDTEPLVTWWENADQSERAAALAIPLVQQRLGAGDSSAALAPAMTRAVRQALLEAVLAAASDIVILPVGDVFGWADRINTPAVVDDVNWTWRLPWTVESLSDRPDVDDVSSVLRALAQRHGRR